jgi:ABC-type antimicrobial peptide transport system permease subunit
VGKRSRTPNLDNDFPDPDTPTQIVRQAVVSALVGLIPGLAVSIALGKMMSAVLYGVVSMDAVTFVAFTILVALISVFAGYLPARPASRIDPIAALRCQ